MRIFSIIILIALNFHAFAQEKVILDKPNVDKRTELLSIVFRLAGKPEYASKQFKLYSDRIEHHFEKYKNHELIQFTKSIMNENGIGYDAVMAMAVHLDEDLKLLTGVKDNWRDSRWSKVNVEKFVPLLQKFYKDAKCDKFFKDNEDLYTQAVKRFSPVYEQLDLHWYRSFYGKEPSETFLIIIGLGNWDCNYAASLDYMNGSRKVYAVMGVWNTDNTGIPEFKPKEYFPVLLHEFNHSFVNYLNEKNKDALRKSGEKIFSVVKDEMTRQAYSSWEPMLNEALVRASVVKYMKDHDFEKSDIDNEIKKQKELGFFWIKELVDELENYDRQRDKYPTLESYMPKLIEAYTTWAEKISSSDVKKPHVVSINEFTNGDTNVGTDIKTITINFNVPLSGKGYSIYLGNKGKDAFPKVEKVNYTNNNQSVVMEVSLEKNKEYQFVLTGKNFTSVDGIGIKDYEVNFKTKNDK